VELVGADLEPPRDRDLREQRRPVGVVEPVQRAADAVVVDP